MKAGSRGSTDTRERFGLRRALVVGAGRAVARARRRRAAVRPQPAQPDDARRRLPAGRHPRRQPRSAARRRAGRAPDGAVYDDITARDRRAARRRRRAAQAFIVPVSGSGWNDNIVIDGVKRHGERQLQRGQRPATSGRWGRRSWPDATSTAATRPGAEKSAIVTELFAQQVLRRPESDRPGLPDRRAAGRPRPVNRIVGVVKDTKYTDLREEFTPLVFFAASQDEQPIRSCRSCCDRRRRWRRSRRR